MRENQGSICRGGGRGLTLSSSFNSLIIDMVDKNEVNNERQLGKDDV